MNDLKIQTDYYCGWHSFLRWALDGSSKICSDSSLGIEFGDRLRSMAGDPVGVACLKSAFAEGWRSTKSIRDKLSMEEEDAD